MDLPGNTNYLSTRHKYNIYNISWDIQDVVDRLGGGRGVGKKDYILNECVYGKK